MDRYTSGVQRLEGGSTSGQGGSLARQQVSRAGVMVSYKPRRRVRAGAPRAQEPCCREDSRTVDGMLEPLCTWGHIPLGILGVGVGAEGVRSGNT